VGGLRRVLSHEGAPRRRSSVDAPLDVVVVGAGLAGLAAGASAGRAGAGVLVVDGHRAGGRARTDERQGFRFNQGAHALYLGGPAARVLEDLGVGVPAGGTPSTDTWGCRGDRISPMPFSALGAARSRLVGTIGAAQLAMLVRRLRSIDTAALANLSAAGWIDSLGLRPEAADIVRLLAHVASYADDLEAISADAVAGQLQLVVTSGVRYLDRGWQVLVDGLSGAVADAGGTVAERAPVAAVEPVDAGQTVVRLVDGRSILARAVVLATGGPAAVASLVPEPPRWGLIGPPATAACLDLGLRRAPAKPVLFGVGEPLYLSTHGPSADLAPGDQAVVHVMRYGARDAEQDRADLWAHAQRAGIRQDDVIEQRFLARMVVTHAVPVPGSGLLGRPSADAAGLPGVFLAGDWVGPEGMLADAALASGAAAGVRAAAHAARLGAVA
jgi:phytoene dehydrogenase-like protein